MACFPPLHAAAFHGDCKRIQELLSGGTEVCEAAEDGSTPLHHACAAGQHKVVRLLLGKMAHVGGKTSGVNGVDARGFSPLHYAASGGHSRSLQLLINAPGTLLDLPDKKERATALHYSAFAGHVACAEQLIGAGANVFAKDSLQQTPLHKAAFGGHNEVAYLIVKHVGADNIAHTVDSNGRTAAHLAAATGHADVLRFLADQKVNINMTDARGNSPLHYAAFCGHYACVLALVSSHAIIDLENHRGNTPLAFATWRNHANCARVLVDEGAVVCTQYRTGKHLSAEIQPDEVPELDDSAYDRFGFFSHPKTNQIQITNTSRKEKQLEKKRIRTEQRRFRKWQSMAERWPGQRGQMHPKARTRVRKGIPDVMRGVAWKLLAGVSAVRNANPGHYERLLKNSSSAFIKQIDIDVARTLCHHRLFRTRYGEGQRNLFNILRAYSIHNQSIGYCQGLSFVAGLLLAKIQDPEDVFWFLHILMTDPRYDMNDMYITNFPKLFDSFHIHERLLEKFSKPLFTHFQHEGISSSMYSTKWYLTVFMYQLPMEVVFRIWDVFLCEGYSFLFAVSLAILEIQKRMLLNSSFEAIMILFTKTLPEQDIGIEKFIKQACKLDKKISAGMVQDLRSEAEKQKAVKH